MKNGHRMDLSNLVFSIAYQDKLGVGGHLETASKKISWDSFQTWMTVE